jgi:hypothetical protein
MDTIEHTYCVFLSRAEDISYYLTYLKLAAQDNDCFIKKIIIDNDTKKVQSKLHGREIDILTVGQLLKHKGYYF